jgi:hypothetical protein
MKTGRRKEKKVSNTKELQTNADNEGLYRQQTR